MSVPAAMEEAAVRPLSTIALAALLLAGCAATQEPQPEAPPTASVESDAAGVLIAALPQGVEVLGNDAAGLRLSVPSENGAGTMTVTLSDEIEGGLNIIDAVEAQMAAFDGSPEGRSFGQTQMVAPIGLTYMVRGRYVSEGAEVEELRAMLAHPWGNRLLTLSYVYPAGEDSKERGGQLMEVLGEMEPLGEPVTDDTVTDDTGPADEVD